MPLDTIDEVELSGNRSTFLSTPVRTGTSPMTDRSTPTSFAAADSGTSWICSDGVNPGVGGDPERGMVADGRTTRPAADN
jgi:hypothetical protein